MSTYWREDVNGTGYQADLRSYQYLDFDYNEIRIKAYMNDGSELVLGTRNVLRYAAAALDRPQEGSVVESEKFDISGWVYSGYHGWSIDHVNMSVNDGDETQLNMYTREDVPEANAFLRDFNTIDYLNYGQNTILLKVYYQNGYSSDMIKRRIYSKALRVKFNTNCDDLSYSDKAVIYGSTYGELPVPERTGYQFKGWYDKQGETEISSNTKVSVEEDQTLYAKWEKNPEPTATPTVSPTATPTTAPTAAPTTKPTPTAKPTATPTPTAAPPTATPTPTPDVSGTTISAGDISAKPGDTIEVPITISDNTGFANLSLEVDYDESVLTLTEVKKNAEVDATFVASRYLTVKPYFLSWNSLENTVFNGTLVTLIFTVSDEAEDGDYAVSVDYYKGESGNYSDGVNINYDEDFEPLGLTYKNGTVTVLDHVPGDVSGDGMLDARDGTFILRKLAGWDIIVNEKALDINGDSVFDAKDGTFLLRRLAGWDIIIY